MKHIFSDKCFFSSGIAIFLLATLQASCDMPECRNTNPVFDDFSYDAIEYKTALAEKIDAAGVSNFKFWFDQYQAKNGREYILLNIQGMKMCAVLELQVNSWEKLDGLRKEISGYRGAELVGLDFDIIKSPTGVNFVFKDVDKIID